MKQLFILCSTLLVFIGHSSAADKPNFIMVFIDDMGWGDFSCFGNQAAETPNVDRLAAEGLRFSQFYVNSPICSPSRCALTTGQYPHRWRLTSFLNNRADNERRGVANWLDPKVPTAERTKRIAQAKAFVGRAGRQVGKEGVQLHGGIGMTWDLPIGHYLKRLMAIDSVLGLSDRQLKRLAEGER